MNNFILLFCSGLALLLAYNAAFIAYNIYIQYNLIDAIPNPMSHSREISSTCDNVKFDHISVYHDIHDFVSAQKIVEKLDRPALFKGYVKEPAARFASMGLDEKVVLFSEVEITSFGNIFLGGLSPVGSVNRTLGEVLNSDTDLSATKALYASFQSFLDIQTADPTIPTNVMADTNFVSNFPRDVLSTHIHAAPLIDSFAVQYLGRKVWVMVAPEDMESYNPISSPATYVTRGSEKEFFSRTSPVLLAVQEEGDMLYFPPHWGHAVMTRAGPNVMLNYRVPAVNPFKQAKTARRFAEALTSALINRLMAFRIAHSHEKLSPLNRDLRALGNAERAKGGYDSPCADTWRAMLNR